MVETAAAAAVAFITDEAAAVVVDTVAVATVAGVASAAALFVSLTISVWQKEFALVSCMKKNHRETKDFNRPLTYFHGRPRRGGWGGWGGRGRPWASDLKPAKKKRKKKKLR